jgi:hypothetical protein
MGPYRGRKQISTEGTPLRRSGRPGPWLPAVEQFVQERPQRPPLTGRQVRTCASLVFGDTPAKRAQHPLAA